MLQFFRHIYYFFWSLFPHKNCASYLDPDVDEPEDVEDFF